MPVPRFRVTERQVLMLFMITSFVMFGGAFLVAGFRQRGQPLERTTHARIRWMPARDIAPAMPDAYLIAEYFDPSLMSLPSAHGFSRRSWQRSAEPPSRAFEPPRELALLDMPPSEKLVDLLPKQSVAEVVQSGVEKMPAVVAEVLRRDTFAATNVVTYSTLHIEGELESRPLIDQPNLPTPSTGAGLRPTRVRVAVAVDGRVRYATLDRSCGNESVDEQGLEMSRRLRFEPWRSSDPLALTWGTVKFSWAVQ